MAENGETRADRSRVRHSRRALHRHAFTLVEMMVAVGLVVFLTGLTLTAAAALVERAEVQRTRDVITLLDQACRDWELRKDAKVTWGPDEDTYDMTSGRAHVLLISELLETIRAGSDPTIALIDEAFLYRYQRGEVPPWIAQDYEARLEFVPFQQRQSIVVLDAWGKPVYPTHPGAPASPDAEVRDADGTERTDNENEYGIALHRRICFVSAGPDGLFGVEREFPLLSAAEQHEAMEAARADNVYSYRPGDPASGGP